MEKENEKSLKMWQMFKDLSIKELESVYKVLSFSYGIFLTNFFLN